MELPARLDEVPADGPVLVVCRVGGRSAQAVQYLRQLDIEALNLDGGLVEWHSAGRPLVADAGVPRVV
jgi:rhodanese-related sulfurtransferase